MSAWFPRWVWGVIHPNFYEVGVSRACVDFLSRKALKQHATYYMMYYNNIVKYADSV